MIDYKMTLDALMASLNAGLDFFNGFLPTFLGATLTLLFGWMLTHYVAILVDKALHRVGFEKVSVNAGFHKFLDRSGSHWTASKAVAEMSKWILRLLILEAAANIGGLPQVSEVIKNILMFTPKLIVAVVLLAAGMMFANFLSRAVRGSVSEMGIGNAAMFSNLIYYAVVGFSVLAALSHLEVAPTIINSLFIAILSSLGLAFGIAFGLGGKDVAGEITRNWYDKSKASMKKSELHSKKKAS